MFPTVGFSLCCGSVCVCGWREKEVAERGRAERRKGGGPKFSHLSNLDSELEDVVSVCAAMKNRRLPAHESSHVRTGSCAPSDKRILTLASAKDPSPLDAARLSSGGSEDVGWSSSSWPAFNGRVLSARRLGPVPASGEIQERPMHPGVVHLWGAYPCYFPCLFIFIFIFIVPRADTTPQAEAVRPSTKNCTRFH